MFRNAKNVGYYMIGSGSLAQLGDLIGARRAAVNGPAVFFIDHFFEGKDLIAKLPVESKDMVVYVDTTNEPTTDSIDGYTDKVKASSTAWPPAPCWPLAAAACLIPASAWATC